MLRATSSVEYSPKVKRQIYQFPTGDPVKTRHLLRSHPAFAVEVHSSVGSMSERAANMILDVAKTGQGTVLTPGCTTPVGMYQQLFALSLQENFAPHFVSLLKGERGDFLLGMIDGVEYPLSDPINFRHYLIEFFFRFFGCPSPRSIPDRQEREAYIQDVFSRFRNVYVPHLPPEGSFSEKYSYVQEFSNWIKDRSPIDLIVCGIGPDGHIAFLEPEQAGWSWKGSSVRRVKLWDEIRRWKWDRENGSCACARLGNCELSKAPEYALTIDLETFLSAKHVVLMAIGHEKAEAVRRMIKDPYQPEMFPAQYLREARGKVTVLLDQSAAYNMLRAAA